MKVRTGLVLVVTGTMLGAMVAGAAGAPITQEAYVLGPDDSIEVVVFQQPDLSRTVTIKPDGTIALPLIDQVKAAGKTTAQLETELDTLYAKYLKAPSVSVTVRGFRKEQIYVLGQVNKPGQYDLMPGVGTGVLELLAAAGGPTKYADLAKAVVIRGKTETTQLNLLEAIKTSKEPAINLQSGDVVYIPEARPRVAVLGNVAKPGQLDVTPNMRLIDAIAEAGGPTDHGNLGKVQIVRSKQGKPVMIMADLTKAFNGKDLSQNLALQDGDIVYVPGKFVLSLGTVLNLARGLFFGF